ncbi:zinc-binding dehydrogenase [Sphingomonas sp. F9_3S_D5_B_2]
MRSLDQDRRRSLAGWLCQRFRGRAAAHRHSFAHHHSGRNGDWSASALRGLLAAMQAHKMKPVIDQVFPFADYEGAYRRLASGQMVGKVVIDVTA